MNDLDPNYLLPLWRALITYFRRFRPLVHDYSVRHTTPERCRSLP